MELLESRRLLTSITEYSVPGGATATPTEITAGPNGTLWFIESGTNAIGMLSTANPKPADVPRGFTRWGSSSGNYNGA